tara:strand:- start:1359 stop:1901 length:543 start_codon:yes stop_codon:yes gene_type:complete
MIFRKNNIVLVGMTGVGKTTIGKLLSKKLDFAFIDIDWEIEKATNHKISDFFEKYGENEFRKIEKKIFFKNLFNQGVTVISTGAGIINDDEIKSSIKNNCISIFLDIDINLLIKRLQKNSRNRPMLRIGNLEKNLYDMYKNRKQNYEASDIKISVSELPVNSVVNKIIEHLNYYGKNKDA